MGFSWRAWDLATQYHHSNDTGRSHVIHIGLLAFAATAAASGAGGDCPSGTQTTLAIEVVSRPNILRHDENIGSDRVVLRSDEGKEVYSHTVNDGHLLCLGFVATSPGRYLVGSVGEQGTWMVLGAVSYLGEDGSPLRASAFTKLRFLALTAVSSPRGSFVAFIGGREGDVDGLYVLDTGKDEIRRLGDPPAPPPVDFDCDDAFQWGTCWADGYTAIDPAVMRFEDESTLVVTYGRDTHTARAQHRRVRRFKL